MARPAGSGELAADHGIPLDAIYTADEFGIAFAHRAAVEEHADLMAALGLLDGEIDDVPEQAAERGPEDMHDP